MAREIDRLNARYSISYFDAEWNEIESLAWEGTASDMIIEIHLWLCSRSHRHSQPLMIFNTYRHACFITIQEILMENENVIEKENVGESTGSKRKRKQAKSQASEIHGVNGHPGAKG